MYKSADIARFVRGSLKPALPESYVGYKSRFLLRTHGNVVQGIIVGVARGGWVRVYPTFYVVGADPSFKAIHQTVSLQTRDPRRWHFAPDTALDEALTREIRERLEHESPVSFEAALDDESLDRGLRWFGRRGSHWSADLFLAFYGMTRGARTARSDLSRARALFQRYSRLASGKPLLDWEERLCQRFQELDSRLDGSECVALCRADSEAHAAELGLPLIVWPTDWPERVPPWPKQSGFGLGGGLRRWVGHVVGRILE